MQLCWTTALRLGAGTLPGYFGECTPGECPSYFLQGIRRTCAGIRLPPRVCSFTRWYFLFFAMITFSFDWSCLEALHSRTPCKRILVSLPYVKGTLLYVGG